MISGHVGALTRDYRTDRAGSVAPQASKNVTEGGSKEDRQELASVKKWKKSDHPQKLLAKAIYLRDPVKFDESIRAGADINAPLHAPQIFPLIAIADEGSSSPVFDRFMALNPKVDVRDKKGIVPSPLSCAVSNFDAKATRALLAAGAPLDWDIREGGWLYNSVHEDVESDYEWRKESRAAIAAMLDVALKRVSTWAPCDK